METLTIRWDVLLIILGAAVVTFIPRVLPLMLLSRIDLPHWAVRWLHYVPIAVMAALIGQALFVREDPWTLENHIEWLAAIPTFLVAIRTRSLLWTVIAGVAAVMLLRGSLALLPG